MHGVEGTFKHKNGEKLKGKFKLTSERKKRKHDKKWKPITWEGKVNDKKIEIIQLCKLPSSIEDFHWKDFPKKFNVVKAYIADAIERHESDLKKEKA